MDTTYSKLRGGRWNPPAEFGALYLNQTTIVAAANARRNYENEIATLFDLRPEERPHLLEVAVAPAPFLNVITAAGLNALKLPKAFPLRVLWSRCQGIARSAYRANGNGIAALSFALAAEGRSGEELAIFDRSIGLVTPKSRFRFSRWYPTETSRRPRFEEF